MRRAIFTVAVLGYILSPTGLRRTDSVALAIVNGVEAGDRLQNVGMLVGRLAPGGAWRWLHCSGTLISRDVFLTAGHCIALASAHEFGVAFPDAIPIDQAAPFFPLIPADVRVYPGTAVHDPRFDVASLPDPAANPFDLAVVRVAGGVAGIRPARVVGANHFEKYREAYQHREIGEAGYGITSFLPNLGLQPWDWGVRRVTTGRLDHVYAARIVVSPEPGQICGGDSGGPGFVSHIGDLDGPLPRYVDALSSIVSWSVGLGSPDGRPCETAAILHRLDTPKARQFLGQFVPLKDDENDDDRRRAENQN